jgi:hypothetical protein
MAKNIITIEDNGWGSVNVTIHREGNDPKGQMSDVFASCVEKHIHLISELKEQVLECDRLNRDFLDAMDEY